MEFACYHGVTLVGVVYSVGFNFPAPFEIFRFSPSSNEQFGEEQSSVKYI